MSNKPSPYSRLDDDHHNDIDDDIDIDFSTNNNINNNNNNEAEHQYSHDEDDEIEQQELNNNIQYNNDNYDIKRTYDDAYEEDYKEQERQEHQQHSQQSQHTQEMTPMFPITMPSTPNTVNLQDLKGDEGEDAWVAASTTNNPSPALAFSPASASATSRLKRFATRFSMSTNKDKVRLKSKSRSKPKLVRNLTQAAIFSSNEDDSNVEMSTALRRRLRDFRFAQSERKDKYGEVNPWGIFGLYDHLTGIRTDIEWAEDAAYRRENDQPYIRWEDFDQTKDTGMNQPFFTYFTMFVCTVCLVVSIGLNGWKVQPISENPMIGPSAEVLIQMGARDTPLIVEENEWYRIFTAMVSAILVQVLAYIFMINFLLMLMFKLTLLCFYFCFILFYSHFIIFNLFFLFRISSLNIKFLHAGVIHFVMNMFALYFVGYAIEQSHGFFAAALLFILPGIGGNLLSTIFLPEYISVGASGGTFVCCKLSIISSCHHNFILYYHLTTIYIMMELSIDLSTFFKTFFFNCKVSLD
jgi:membrane associated rhomboid family serine protease